MTNNEKRYVEVDVDWDDENKVWYEYDGDGSYNTYSTTATLPELILKEHPGLREKIIRFIDEIAAKTFNGDGAFTSARIADSILSILGINKEG